MHTTPSFLLIHNYIFAKIIFYLNHASTLEYKSPRTWQLQNDQSWHPHNHKPLCHHSDQLHEMRQREI